MEDQTYVQIKRSVKSLLNINLDYYKDQQVRRRLDYWLVRTGARDWTIYFKQIESDQTERDKFRNYLTINVSKFFRDTDRWEMVRKTYLPRLIADTRNGTSTKGLRIWSAGCSIGAEPYTLAIILDELGNSRNHSILATDLDRGALAIAKAGGPYTAEDVETLSPAQKQNYLRPGGPPHYLKDVLGRVITFREHDLIQDAYGQDFDMIVCRNVVIYFTAETKDLIYRKFTQALRPGGLLFLGGTEIVSHPNEFGLRSLGMSFYQKPER